MMTLPAINLTFPRNLASCVLGDLRATSSENVFSCNFLATLRNAEVGSERKTLLFVL